MLKRQNPIRLSFQEHNPSTSLRTGSRSRGHRGKNQCQVPRDREDIALHIYDVDGRLVKAGELERCKINDLKIDREGTKFPFSSLIKY